MFKVNKRRLWRRVSVFVVNSEKNWTHFPDFIFFYKLSTSKQVQGTKAEKKLLMFMLSYMCKYDSRNCRTHGKNNRKAYISLQSKIREIRKKSKAWFPSSINSSSFKLFFWNYFSSSGLILFGINSITFPLIIKSNVDLFQLILRWVKASQKKKLCYFFC